ncbi:aspartate kinase [Streptomyces sp. DvalAA-14]|uniref:aspartate kinase n=1 Tax=unclassified Streptomyces TaxID=2593676 RepID=UPI00081B902E|nr:MULTISPECIES: aspartate kinase [unclassified Streptomyces]MYS19641.1 aspartate kinase [Streptomyces sp. SID4948]SCD49525.1 aspartate kinase [Streptomyces sp. DvalAA-14]
MTGPGAPQLSAFRSAESVRARQAEPPLPVPLPLPPPLPLPDGLSARRVVWKFGGSSVGDVHRLRAVAQRLVAAHRQGLQVVAVLSAMSDSTDDLLGLAYGLSPRPQSRELDALLSVGESMSCALAAIAVHELGEHAISLSGTQAGFMTDEAHGNARLHEVRPWRVVEALEAGSIVLVTGYQGITAAGDVTTLGRGGSDASAIALAAALGLTECDIHTDVTGVFTADPRLVPAARRMERLSHEEMLQLAEAGAQVMQPRAVELAAAYDIDIHVRSSFTTEPGTWIKKESPLFENTRIAGVAHRRHDPLYTVSGLSPATVSAALAERGMPVGSMIRDLHDPQHVRFTSPGTEAQGVIAALGDVGAAVEVHGEELGSVSVVSTVVSNRAEITSRILDALEGSGISPLLVTSTPSRVSCHITSDAVEQATRALHEAFDLQVEAPELAAAVPGTAS